MEQILSVRVARIVRRLLEPGRLRRELASIDDTTRSELRLHTDTDVTALIRNARGRPDRMRRMLARLRLDEHPALANLGFRRDLERTCALCPVARTCERWLASGDREGYGAFCPNATELSAMAAGQRVAHDRRSIAV